MAAPNKPPMLYVLAGFALVLGTFGTLYATSSAAQYLLSRDQFVQQYREQAEKQLHLPGEHATREQLLQLCEREADALYARRGLSISLAAMNAILSMLLFAGAARAMRGLKWGLSAWSLAASASIPYTVLALTASIVEARDLLAIYRPLGALGDDLSFARRLLLAWSEVKAAVEILYFGACVIYLRRPSLRKLFTT